jgi:hypothetical protein
VPRHAALRPAAPPDRGLQGPCEIQGRAA